MLPKAKGSGGVQDLHQMPNVATDYGGCSMVTPLRPFPTPLRPFPEKAVR